MKRTVAASLLLLGCATPIAAQVYSVDGKCTSLKIGTRNLTPDCKPNVAKADLNANSISFFFTLQSGGFVEFVGSDGPNPSDSSDIVNLREVVLKAIPNGIEDEKKKVSGMCLYDDPDTPDPRIVCTATSREGEVFSAEFRVTQGSVVDITKPQYPRLQPPESTQEQAAPKASMSQGYDVTDEEIAAAQAPPPPEFVAVKTLNLCNKSKRKIELARYQKYSTAIADQDYVVAGWLHIESGDCAEITYPDGDFAFYALDGRGREWSGNRRLCVEESAFKRIYMEQYRCSKRFVRGFKNFRSDELYDTVTLN